MFSLEERLREHFAQPVPNPDVSGASTNLYPDEAQYSLDTPFATVRSVLPGGPADLAGLRAGDQIIHVNHINHTNHNNLQSVALCVQENEGVRIMGPITQTWFWLLKCCAAHHINRDKSVRPDLFEAEAFHPAYPNKTLGWEGSARLPNLAMLRARSRFPPR